MLDANEGSTLELLYCAESSVKEKERQLRDTLPHIAEFRRVFKLFDRCGCDRIVAHDLGGCLRAWGLSPNKAELRRYTGMHELSPSPLTFVELLKIYYEIASAVNYQRAALDLIAGLRHFDVEGKGFISRRELHRLLTSYGDKLSENEFCELLSDSRLQPNSSHNGNSAGEHTSADPNDGIIDYVQFVHQIIGGEQKWAETQCCIKQVETYLGALGHRFSSPLRSSYRTQGRPHNHAFDFIQGLRKFDVGDTGFIYPADLRLFLTSLGEQMSDEAFAAMLMHVGQQGPRINYKEFVHSVMHDA